MFFAGSLTFCSCLCSACDAARLSVYGVRKALARRDGSGVPERVHGLLVDPNRVAAR
mgnify:CR=1 FL=1